ncbi:hypothetical protein ACFY5D_21140 [Paeniglutamicibacter sp. NPDC012692]|uniref:hypothetical protein n=1 Tax=Paeniglutamicibacter sp. NPDC012692 TaxID=3364388 RepID=UPI0036C0AC59
MESREQLTDHIRHAVNIGKYASREGGSFIGSYAHHPGDNTGRYVIEAYRGHGPEGVRAVVLAYLESYNEHARELGARQATLQEIKNGLEFALPGATEAEAEAIHAAL